jgi:hypothetical protein
LRCDISQCIYKSMNGRTRKERTEQTAAHPTLKNRTPGKMCAESSTTGRAVFLGLDFVKIAMLNSDGFAVMLGRGLNGGDTGRPPTQNYYCGRRVGECRCGRCDGRCGPTNGCPCNSCKALTLSGQPHVDIFVKCARGHNLALNGRSNGWYCDAQRENGGCRAIITGENRARWRCIDESCDFDYCGECYSFKLSQLCTERFVVNCEGAKAFKCQDRIHTRTERHYCGRNVGRGKYANDCQLCNGRCGPTGGCQCRACFLIDSPQFLSPAALRLTSRPTDQRTSLLTISSSELSSLSHPSPSISYRNCDLYNGELNDKNQRQGYGVYSLCLGHSASSRRYLDYPGEWSDNQLIKYFSFQNIWWKCCQLSSSFPLTPLPPDPARPSFDVNLLKAAEYLCLGSAYFYLKIGQRMVLLQQGDENSTVSLPSPPADNADGVMVNGLWVEQGLSVTLHFSHDFSVIESGNILHSSSQTVLLSFGIVSTESGEGEAEMILAEYRPTSVDQKIFQVS